MMRKNVKYFRIPLSRSIEWLMCSTTLGGSYKKQKELAMKQCFIANSFCSLFC